MFDLHQGFTFPERTSAEPQPADIAFAQLDAASALAKGRLRDAATQQARAARLLAQLAAARLRAPFDRKRCGPPSPPVTPPPCAYPFIDPPPTTPNSVPRTRPASCTGRLAGALTADTIGTPAMIAFCK